MSVLESKAEEWVTAHYAAREREAVACYEGALARLRQQRLKVNALTAEHAPVQALEAEREFLEAVEAEADAKRIAVELVSEERGLALSALLEAEIAAEQQKIAAAEQVIKASQERIEILRHERTRWAGDGSAAN